MKIRIYLLLLCELCFEISKADIKPKSPKKDKRLNFLGRNKNVSISEEWHQHKNDHKPLEEQSFEELTLHNFTEKTANFGFNLYGKIAMKLDNNIIISPLSVTTLMATYLLAAEGETHRQIAKALNLHSLKDRDRHYLPALFKQLKDNITTNEELLFVQGPKEKYQNFLKKLTGILNCYFWTTFFLKVTIVFILQNGYLLEETEL